MLMRDNSTLIIHGTEAPDDTRMIDAKEAISLQHVINYGKYMPRLSPMA